MKNPVVDIFLDLVKIDSPSGEEQKVAEYILKFLTDRNIEAKQDHYGNVVGRIQGIGEPIILAAHMDTVEPGRGIKPIVENGIIKGDGTTILGADNKNWLAAILAAIDSRLKMQDSRIRNVDLVFTREEEIHDGGAVHLDLRMLRGKRGFSCDDGSPLGTIFVKSPYYIKIDIKVIGKSAHSAEPEKADNALKAASEAIHVLPLGDIGNSTIRNIGMMNSGSGRNTIPGEVTLVAEIRSFTKENLAVATTEMINLFRNIAKKHNCVIKKHVELENAGFWVNKDDQTLLDAKNILKKMGIEAKLEETYGCFDANYFNARGIHIINMSDGASDSHTTREQVTIESLEELQELAQRLMALGIASLSSQ